MRQKTDDIYIKKLTSLRTKIHNEHKHISLRFDQLNHNVNDNKKQLRDLYYSTFNDRNERLETYLLQIKEDQQDLSRDIVSIAQAFRSLEQIIRKQAEKKSYFSKLINKFKR